MATYLKTSSGVTVLGAPRQTGFGGVVGELDGVREKAHRSGLPVNPH